MDVHAVTLIGTVRSFGNKGDEAIYITSIKLIRKYLPNIKVILAPSEFSPSYAVLRSYRPDTIIRHPMWALVEAPFISASRGHALKRAVKAFSYHSPPRISALILKVLNCETSKCFKDTDLFIITPHPLEIEGFPTYIASFMIPSYFNPKIPIIAFPLSISTSIMHSYRRRVLVKKALKKASIILTRGRYTTRYLKETFKVDNILTSFDPAIMLPKILPKCKPSNGIMITPAGLTLPPQLLAKLIDLLVKKLERKCFICPTSTGDLHIARDALRIVENKHSCEILDTKNMSPHEVKGLLSHAEVLITSRVHAAIFALSEFVPVVSILREDDVKFYDVLEAFGLDNYIISPGINYINQPSIAIRKAKRNYYGKDTINRVVKTTKSLIDNRSLFVKNIKKRLPQVIARAELAGLVLKNFISE